jgi:hypothetical protein
MKRLGLLSLLFLVLGLSSGCFFTRFVTMPMRLVGGVCTIIPLGPGDIAHDAIDKAASWVDEIPI